MNQSSPADPLSLGQKLVAVLEGGRRTSTYKLATILALLDLAVESVPEHPDDAVDIDLNSLSERVLAMYWRQIRPIEGVQVRQSSDGRSAILAIVETLRIPPGFANVSDRRLLPKRRTRMGIGRLSRPSKSPSSATRFNFCSG